MIKSVLFDLDRTLLDRDTSFRSFVISQYAKFSRELRHIPESTYIDRVVALDNHGLRWKDDVYKMIVEEFAIETLGWKPLFDDFDARIADFYVLFPNARNMLVELRQHGYKLGLITNGKGYFQRRTLKALDIERNFDVILVSEEEGVRKPEPEIFNRALSRLDCNATEAVFVGDSIEADIAGARQAGMLAIWKHDNQHTGDVGADAIVDDLNALPAIIDALATRRAAT